MLRSSIVSAQCDLFQGLGVDEIQRIVDTSRRVAIASGQTVCQQGETGSSMFVLVAGRVSVSVDRPHGERVVLNYLGQGNHFGELSMLIGGPRTATVTAVMDTELLELTRADFHQLMATIPGFAANLSRTLGVWLRGEIRGRRQSVRTLTVAIVRTTLRTDTLAMQLVRRLEQDGEAVQVLTDRSQQWRRSDHVNVQTLASGLESGELAESRRAVRRALAMAIDRHGHVVVDIDYAQADPNLLMQCELVWWPVEVGEPVAPGDRLKEILDSEPRLGDRIQPLWLHREGNPPPPSTQSDVPLTQVATRIGWKPDDRQQALFRPHDLARLVHRLRGLHFGLALGGGGARGVAHIGVLRALERAGIYFDRIAGTSAGAMIGAMYAAGYAPDQLLEMVEQELTPPRWLRRIPTSKRWFMLGMYRLGRAEPKLRRYLHDWTFDQLLTPTHTISVDLISGSERVRESGNIVDAILESINLPVIGAPIFRDGDALVDGGVLINVPATVLRKRQANFVVAVDVGSKLAPRFGRNTPSTPTSETKRPGMLETIIRVTEVQQRGLASIHASEGDFLITPDTSNFPFDDFTQGDQLSEIGEATAEEAIPQLKQMLADLQESSVASERQVA